MKIPTTMQRMLAAGVACAALCLASTPSEVKDIIFSAVPDGIDAYVYGYPLVTMECSFTAETNKQ